MGHFGFSAVLRDYARLGRLLACDGVWDGKQLIPASWLHGATTVRASEGYLAPGSSMKFGYGYLLWLLPGSRRQFALLGQNGQRICVGCPVALARQDQPCEGVDRVTSSTTSMIATLDAPESSGCRRRQ